jgi:hypothetical protein
MARTVYSLLVGIDEYPAPVRSLHGCVNDILSLAELLRERVRSDDDQFDAVVLTDQLATRQNVIDGFARHLTRARARDVALFAFCGHGSQAQTPPELWHLEPDRLDETLVCFDSRRPGGYDLADKEIAKLLAQVAAGGAHIVVILDSCHSASGTRDATEPGVRRTPMDRRDRSLDSYLVSASEARMHAKPPAAAQSTRGWLRLPRGRHVVMSACREDEQAREVPIGGAVHGLFSHFLVDTLRRLSEAPSYRDLFKRVNALVRVQAAGQHPVIEATDLQDLEQPFLGGTIRCHARHFTVSFDTSDGWVVDGGAVHGVPEPHGDETTYLALFPLDAVDLWDGQQVVGEARVSAVMPSRSRVVLSLTCRERPAEDTTFKAVPTALPLPPLGVRIEGEASAAALVRAAMNKAGPDKRPSLLVREMPAAARVLVAASRDGYRILATADSRALCADIPSATPASAQGVVSRLEHIARWSCIAQLDNPVSALPPGAVRLELFAADHGSRHAPRALDGEVPASSITLHYRHEAGQCVPPSFRLRLMNTSDMRLFCILLALTETYMVAADLLPGGGIWLGAGEEAWALGGDPIVATVPDRLFAQGTTQLRDLIKLIVSTEECDATLLAQDELGTPFDAYARLARTPVRSSSLDRLMRRVQARHLSGRPGARENIVDWLTSEVAVTTVRLGTGAAEPAGSGGRAGIRP